MKTIKRGTIIGAISLLVLAVGCSKPPKISGSAGGAASGDQVPEVEGLPSESLELFTSNVYEPISGQFCNSCHHEESGHHESAENSHNYFLERGADFTKVESSSTVVRVRGGHSCWGSDCNEDADILQAGIQAWLDELVARGFELPEQEFGAKAKATTAFADSTDHTLVVNPAEYMGGAISAATTTNTWATPVMDSPDGAINGYVTAPAGGNPRNANDAAAGTAAYNIEVATAGVHYVWVRAMLPDDDQNEFFVNDGANDFTLIGDPTVDQWAWRQLMTEDDEPVPQEVTLAAGPQTITLREREGGARLSYVLVTPRMDPNTEIFAVKLYDVEVDISDVAGTNASIIATVWEKAQGEDQKKVIGVKELRVKSDKPLTIKGIYPLIDNYYASSHATYSLVEGTFGTPEGEVVATGGATGSTWLAEFATANLGFAFDSVSVAQ
ncbi:hypothetical protein [Pseudobacteriovorax antillogorgiicola]|uniref:Uncharacterized protein n=1 Tax=Pseudobacteriovorax antillogorgiicola TaxID=1513793 RepID=A0A1Y6BZL9_9BACT|nr:hypothetical protein [Pseudobacteriovorax antillogorgiicola]TCS52407.1 hypothetical protein EDD56_109152 [Pseudobacteriovorax antillogorgiicola]SMF28906.1 hypothetical protein SAMN06296036_10961 [Pseudobacteriovorax antillogorgiicola]